MPIDAVHSRIICVSKKLLECVISQFPEDKDYILTYLPNLFLNRDKSQLASEIFPDKCKPDLKNQAIYRILINDSDSQLPLDPKSIEIEINSYYYYSIGYDSLFISLIDLSCAFGAAKCFQKVILNQFAPTKTTGKWAVAGGNMDILKILQDKEILLGDFIATSVIYHRYDVTHWLLQNYDCPQIYLTTAIEY